LYNIVTVAETHTKAGGEEINSLTKYTRQQKLGGCGKELFDAWIMTTLTVTCQCW
jgi:hypothetical protein